MCTYFPRRYMRERGRTEGGDYIKTPPVSELKTISVVTSDPGGTETSRAA